MKKGFTLIEILISVAILSVILLLSFNMISNTEEVIRKTSKEVETFTEARNAFYQIQKQVEQALLNIYWDYERSEEGYPISFERKSDLHFVSGPAKEILEIEEAYFHSIFFVAPLGYTEDKKLNNLKNLLNVGGYYISYQDDLNFLPEFLKSKFNFPKKYRYRLMELRLPAEKMTIYDIQETNKTLNELENANKEEYYRWFNNSIPSKHTKIIANNIIALILMPLSNTTEENFDEIERAKIAPEYLYDTREFQWGEDNERTRKTKNRLPSSIRITLVAISEDSALRLAKQNPNSEQPINLEISELFQYSDEYQEDLFILKKKLNDKNLDYKIFTATIGIKDLNKG